MSPPVKWMGETVPRWPVRPRLVTQAQECLVLIWDCPVPTSHLSPAFPTFPYLADLARAQVTASISKLLSALITELGVRDSTDRKHKQLGLSVLAQSAPWNVRQSSRGEGRPGSAPAPGHTRTCCRRAERWQRVQTLPHQPLPPTMRLTIHSAGRGSGRTTAAHRRPGQWSSRRGRGSTRGRRRGPA